jgi:hypothetical protein
MDGEAFEIKEHPGVPGKAVLVAGMREALAAALDGVPLESSLGVLVRTATLEFGPDARAGFYLANPERTAFITLSVCLPTTPKR